MIQGYFFDKWYGRYDQECCCNVGCLLRFLLVFNVDMLKDYNSFCFYYSDRC